MSNQTFLYSTDSPKKPLYHECPDDGALLMAAMSIPVFWYMLYDKSCLKRGPTEDDPKDTYLHMTTTTAKGLARAKKRWPEVSRVLGRGVEPLFRTWCTFVRGHAKKYVHCETAEWYWMFKTHAEFEKELRTCLAAFDHVPKSRRDGSVALNKWWDHLLTQAHVDVIAGDLRPLGNNSYCGFEFGFDVPWSQDEDEGCGVLKKELRDAPAVGKGPADIRGYLDRWGRVDEFRVARCGCGSEVFRLRYDAEVAERTCASCGAVHLMLDSAEYWEVAKPKDWKCAACGSDLANLGVGFSVAIDGRLWGFSVGQRCGKCGKIGCCVGGETAAGKELFDRV